jgi:hypothetical protein
MGNDIKTLFFDQNLLTYFLKEKDKAQRFQANDFSSLLSLQKD